jgi:hypothetical protein
MYQEKRPTCVTVIGWVWIVLGGLMLFSGFMALLGSLLIRDVMQGGPAMPSYFKFYPVLVAVQLIVATLGLVAGVNFLKLKPWSRGILEGVTWTLLVFVVGYVIFWVASWLALSAGHGAEGFRVMGAAMGVFVGAF